MFPKTFQKVLQTVSKTIEDVFQMAINDIQKEFNRN